MDLESGTIYLGATNFLFQLTSDLMLENMVQTGPVLDSKDCLPPVSKLECPQAHHTDNHNKLLLVNTVQKELIVCGSVHQGICEKRSLASIDHVLFRPESPGDTQYVAANDPNITTVGLIAYSKDEVPLLFVGRGYTSRGVGGGIPPITTRNLRAHGGDIQATDSHSIFSYEETAKLAVGRLSEYNHHFIKSFTYRSSVYFLFYRRDLKSQSREYKTYISRICLDDSHYYSYVELPLLCQSKANTYSLLQAAYVTQPGKELAQGQLDTEGEVLFAAFSAWQASSGKLSEESALCVYAMEEVDRLTNWTRDVCYMRDGKSEEGTEVAYIEYDVSSNCVQLPAVSGFALLSSLQCVLALLCVPKVSLLTQMDVEIWVKSLWAQSVVSHMGRIPCRGRGTVCGSGKSIWCDLALGPVVWQYQARALKLLFKSFFICVISWSALQGRRGACVLAPVCWEGSLRAVLGPYCLW